MKIHHDDYRRLNPCRFCGHPDDRDETHARGCPHIPPANEATVHQMQRDYMLANAPARKPAGVETATSTRRKMQA
jgi:hypothetical protein